MIGVLDYGIGNIGSILNMLKKAGAEAVAVTTGESLSACGRLILPGVGAFDQGMALLNQSGMRGALDEAVASGKPVLGICLGMQMLGLRSEEGNSEGLGYIPFSMRRFRPDGHPELKVPHMGWDRVEIVQRGASLVQGLEQPARFYFVHSYYAVCEDAGDVLMECDYGVHFAAAVHRGNVWGVQFHPEKSHRFGLQLLTAFQQGAQGAVPLDPGLRALRAGC